MPKHTEPIEVHKEAASTAHTKEALAYKGNTVQHTAKQSKAEQRTTATAVDSHNTRHKRRHQPNTRRLGRVLDPPRRQPTHAQPPPPTNSTFSRN